jgi:hypothetical protein
MKLDKYAKAIAACLVAGYAVYQIATGASSPAGAGITVDEWISIAMTALAAGAATWAIPNAKD